MTGSSDAAIRVLVVEDEFTLATELCSILKKHGISIIGPVGNVDAALAAITSDLEVALLDINLHGKPVFPVADRLMQLDIPFAFTSGYDASVIPSAYRAAPRLEKPIEAAALTDVISELLGHDLPARS